MGGAAQGIQSLFKDGAPLGRRHLTRRRVHTAHWTTSFLGAGAIDKSQILSTRRQTAEICRRVAPRIAPENSGKGVFFPWVMTIP